MFDKTAVCKAQLMLRLHSCVYYTGDRIMNLYFCLCVAVFVEGGGLDR